MSQDQKPKPIKAVAIATESETVSSAEAQASADEEASASVHEGAEQAAKPGFPLVPAILFLLACVLGGAGLTALSHFMPEFAKRLYGTHL